MQVISAWRTEAGRLRTSNEDNLFCDGLWLENGRQICGDSFRKERRFHTYAVADGMGGEKYGEVASVLAMRTLAKFDTADAGRHLPEFIRQANLEVCEETMRRSVSSMGAAIAALTIAEDQAVICNLGDCRIYRYDGSGLTQLSVDHRSDAQGFMKGTLTQHLGVPEEEFLVEPYVKTESKLKPGTIFLLCTDGLTDMITDAEMESIFQKFRRELPQKLADALVKEALHLGGRDNVTAMVIMIR